MVTATIPTGEMVELLRRELTIDVDDPDCDLIDRGLVDSLGFTTLFVAVEDRYGIEITLDDLDLERFRTPRLIGEFVAAKLTERERR